MKPRFCRIASTARLLVALAVLAGACQLFSPVPVVTPTDTKQAPSEIPLDTPYPTPHPSVQPPAGPQPAAQMPVFAVFQEPAVQVALQAAHPPIAADLSNVRLPMVLSQPQKDRLARDGLVVSPGAYKEFFNLYEQARYDNIPIFITSDSILHTYHLLFDKVLRTAETTYFIPLLRDLNQALLNQAEAQYEALKDTSWEQAAQRGLAFIGVGARLLDPQIEVPDAAQDLVQAELSQITAADGIRPSPLFPGLEFGEDYTQYIPRGHYTRSPELMAYFKSMMWYGRMTFRLRVDPPVVGRAETRAALMVVQALREAEVRGRPALEAWEALYSPTVFFVGRSDDLTVVQYMEVMDAVYGPRPGPVELADEGRLDQFIELADRLPPPRILGLVISDLDDEEATTKGLRFMGQRFVPDAYVFRQLIYRNVGTRAHRRGLPRGLDWFAAMGSERAYQHLEAMGDTEFENYPAQMAKMRTWLVGLTVADWTETLYNAWLYSFYPLLETPGEGYPAFMQSAAWLDKQLNTCLGSWAELKHDTILYAKQVYAEMGAGPAPPEPLRPRGYVEPVPYFFARLEALTAMTRQGLASRNLLDDLDRASLERLEGLAGALRVMAEKELRGEPLTEDEYERIRFYGGELEHLTMAAADSETEDPFAPRYMDEEPQAAVIADVATDPDYQGIGVSGAAVLEEAIGRVNPIYVVVPLREPEGSVTLQVAKGGVFSYYEFVQPIAERLTDEAWRQMLETGQVPEPPGWTTNFAIPETEHRDLDQAILEYQRSVTFAYWKPEDGLARSDTTLQPFQADLMTMAQARQYAGHQLIHTQVRSFDLQSSTLAVIAVRETWQDVLYQMEGDYPSYDEPVAASRGPYDLDVTYTLEQDAAGAWRVVRIVLNNALPVWQ